MPIPAALPVSAVSADLEMVDGKLSGCESSVVHAGGSDRLGISLSVKGRRE